MAGYNRILCLLYLELICFILRPRASKVNFKFQLQLTLLHVLCILKAFYLRDYSIDDLMSS